MQVTIISGASRGIGKAIAENLKDLEGAHINLSTRNANFEDYEIVYDGTVSLLKCFEGIDKINIVLFAAQIGKYKSLSLKEAEKLFKINVLGNMAIINAALTTLAKLRIVWFAGGGAAFPYPEFFAYSLSKVAVVRAVENLSNQLPMGSCIIALAPGAVETDMLKAVTNAGCEIRTRTEMSEPVNFVRKFITDDSDDLNGMFLHVRDDVTRRKKDIYKLRRIE